MSILRLSSFVSDLYLGEGAAGGADQAAATVTALQLPHCFPVGILQHHP